MQINFPSGIEHDGSTPYPLIEALKTDFSFIEEVCGIYLYPNGLITFEEEKFPEESILFTKPEFFRIFDYEWILGNPDEALLNPGSVVLTESIAKKYFNNEDPIGKTFTLDNYYKLSVTGIIKDPPKNSHIPFCMVIPEKMMSEKAIGSNYNRWTRTLPGMACYILLPEKHPALSMDKQLDDLVKKYYEDEDHEMISFSLQALDDIHYNTRYDAYDYSYLTNRKNLIIFSIVGLLILIIACINFINIATTQAIKRSREVGIRKTIGATRGRLIRHFMGETYLISFISIIFSLILAEIFLPDLNNFLGYGINIRLYGSLAIIVFLIIIFTIIGFLSGFYPAMVLSSYKPSSSLSKKAELSSGRKISLRSILVVFQFIITQILIICSIIISLQINFFQNKDLGFFSKDIINVEFPNAQYSKKKSFQTTIEQFPEIKKITLAYGAPTANSNLGTIFNIPGSEEEYRVSFKPVDQNYMQTFKLNLLAGEWLPPYNAEDTLKHYIVNKELINTIGLIDPIDAIGKEIIFNGWRGDIRGVLQNFHMSSIKNNIEPVVLLHYPGAYGEANIHIDPINIDKAIKKIKTVWEEFFPEDYFKYQYIDDFLTEQYESENRIFTIIKVFSLIAILISCLGLFGLVSYITAQKTKEVGIRKAIGASVGKIVILLSAEFSKWVLLANIVSWPVAWFVMNKWLQNFAYPIDMPLWVFPLSALVSLIIALMTVSYQAIRTANSNPVEALRYE